MLDVTSRICRPVALAFLSCAMGVPIAAQEADVQRVIDKVNSDYNSVTERNKSYTVLFDAALAMSAPPSASGSTDSAFNLNTIHPKMSDWQAVSDWAEANPAMRQAVLDSHHRLILGLPYGREIDAKYLSAGMYADIAVEGNLRVQDFGYMKTMDLIAAFAVAEGYRLLEANQAQQAVDFLTAEVYVIDQFCERGFVAEKMHAMQMQIDFLAALRDMMYLYEDVFTSEQLASPDYDTGDEESKKGLAFELPWLRIDLLQMPEGDYEVAHELLQTVFTADEADPLKFAEVFAELQAKDRPLTQFGAAKRWKMVAAFHASKKATEDHLKLVHDDWWRRWGIRAWHQYLDLDPEYERTNPIRFAAVIYALRDMEDIFPMRRQLQAASNGTSLAAALIAYKKRFNTYPTDLERAYATFVRKRFDVDPFDKEGGAFGYRWIGDTPVNVVTDDLQFVEVTGSLLWARGQDFESQRGEEHSDDGLFGDIVYWPPLRALAREQQ